MPCLTTQGNSFVQLCLALQPRETHLWAVYSVGRVCSQTAFIIINEIR